MHLRPFPLGDGAIFYATFEAVEEGVRAFEHQRRLGLLDGEADAADVVMVSMAQGLFHCEHNGWRH